MKKLYGIVETMSTDDLLFQHNDTNQVINIDSIVTSHLNILRLSDKQNVVHHQGKGS